MTDYLKKVCINCKKKYGCKQNLENGRSHNCELCPHRIPRPCEKQLDITHGICSDECLEILKR